MRVCAARRQRFAPSRRKVRARFIIMSEKDSQSSIDTAQPTPDAAKRLTEEEKKALELGGLLEHEHGQKREDLEKQVKELTD